ncbi:PP2C family protein-serine/threonine phosphatase [Streptomyces caniscabiei]|uniref:PP2C family protein-serine/threonine phosphatase n=1 Tax=Streptomyces caniscabiei TaxID=2746961 RepID=UPI0029A32B77|nr:PP2C family protein-serine/threonine phosphatase [Streptomyces caniscabiei]MDX2601888.1 PP2C family protein-serine/threonine phosphatase [Streptomyces caniscabiei]MDX2737323.1 PP2C family protein-serine/threonine phosphatase [Streptomyces caniscabiei]MDX2784859.1 PP2C family protein-serine/threonine phosphatase [Streptomyces caniscabiei]
MRMRMPVPFGRRDPDPVARQQPLRIRGRNVAWLPPLVVLLAVPVVDWFTGGDFRVISWLVLVPGTAAAVCRVWTTALFAALAMLTYIVGDNSWPHQERTGLPDFVLVALGGILSVLACAVRLRGQERMLHMRAVVDTTRRILLRQLPPDVGGLDHAEIYLAADSEARVGGDFYDIQPSPHGTRVVIGDVQGKGLAAVEAASVLLGTFREAAYHEAEPATVAERLETRMVRHVRYCAHVGRDDAERFATAVLLDFPELRSERTDWGPDLTGLDALTVDVVNFGHEPPLLLSPRGVRFLPLRDGLPLGLAELAPRETRTATVRLAADETLLLVTDGVTEARDGRGVFFPLREYVARALAAGAPALDPGALVRLVRDGVLAHTGGGLDDDTTIFAVRRATEPLRRAPGAPS